MYASEKLTHLQLSWSTHLQHLGTAPELSNHSYALAFLLSLIGVGSK